jgi:hypothetical protein
LIKDWIEEGEMTKRFLLLVLLVGLIWAPIAARAQSGEPGDCPNDSKLLNGGPTAVFGDGPGTWWGLITDGLNNAGFVDEADQVAYLNHVFGTDYDNLDDLKVFNLNLLSDTYDQNQNGFICAYELRGTRAHFDDPFINLTFFGVGDDKLSKK